jgi:hypothetical protein
MYSILNCHNVAKDTKFYLGYLWFNVTSASNAADVPPVVNILPHATSLVSLLQLRQWFKFGSQRHLQAKLMETIDL